VLKKTHKKTKNFFSKKNKKKQKNLKLARERTAQKKIKKSLTKKNYVIIL